MLPATIQLCSTLARLAMLLDKRPDLTRRVQKVSDIDQGERKSLVEKTAETIQKAFTMCLTERTSNVSGVGQDGKPEGKKIGIYSFANLVLKLLFRVRRDLLHQNLPDRQLVSKNPISKTTLYEHPLSLSSIGKISRKSAGYLPLLSRALSVLQQSFLLGTTSPPIGLRPVPYTMP